MHAVKAKNLEEAFYLGMKLTKEYGQEINVNGSKTIEVTNVSFEIKDPSDLNIKIPERKFNKNYAFAEWLWYLSTARNVVNIEKLAKIWSLIKDENNEVESNYGNLMKPQWPWVLVELVNNPESRRCTFTINDVHHKGASDLDYPCTQSIQFMIRDNKLNMTVNMRSNDVVFGFCNDVFTFCLFQQLMLSELNHRTDNNYELGTYNHSAASFHVYEKHYQMMNDICSNKNLYEMITSQDNKKILLKNGITWNNIIEQKLYLPKEDISKEEIYKFVIETTASDTGMLV